MKIARNSIFYLTTIVVFLISIWLILQKGKDLEILHRGAINPSTLNQEITHDSVGIWGQLTESVHESFQHPLSILLLQILIIILISRLFAFLFQKIKQPAVIGEVMAGILLGPSFLGLFFPGIFTFVFPQDSLVNLQFLSQIGLILFMFIIGMELGSQTTP
ncbi:MAG: cation:proton antiporter [Bacteroidales bacterium]|nr:cation:proton antiporter [Bacteroidales bacterium]